MSNVVNLCAQRATLLAQSFWAAYHEHEERLHLVGLRGPCLALTDDGDHVWIDLAACLTISLSLPRLTVSTIVLRDLKAGDPAAHRLLSGAATAYFRSRELREELGRVAVMSFEQLQAALSEAA